MSFDYISKHTEKVELLSISGTAALYITCHC